MSISQLFQPNNFDLYCNSITTTRAGTASVRNQDIADVVISSGSPLTVLLSLPAWETPQVGVVDLTFICNVYHANTAAVTPNGFRYSILRDGVLVGQNTWKFAAIGNGEVAEYPMTVRVFDTKPAGSHVYSVAWEDPSPAGSQSYTVTVKERTLSADVLEWS